MDSFDLFHDSVQVWAASAKESLPLPLLLPPPRGSVKAIPTPSPLKLLWYTHTQGADAPLSGLVAMLTALQLLARGSNSSSGGPGADFQRQLVFAALAGEPWGYMGSRAFLWQLESGAASVAGLDLSLVDQVIEVGAVGRALLAPGDGPAVLYAHTQRGGAFGDATPLVAALQEAAVALPDALKVIASAHLLRLALHCRGVVVPLFGNAWGREHDAHTSPARCGTGDRVACQHIQPRSATVQPHVIPAREALCLGRRGYGV